MAETKLPPGMQAADAVIDAALESGLVADLKAAFGNRDWDWAAHVAELEATLSDLRIDYELAIAAGNDMRAKLAEARALGCKEGLLRAAANARWRASKTDGAVREELYNRVTWLELAAVGESEETP